MAWFADVESFCSSRVLLALCLAAPCFLSGRQVKDKYQQTARPTSARWNLGHHLLCRYVAFWCNLQLHSGSVEAGIPYPPQRGAEGHVKVSPRSFALLLLLTPSGSILPSPLSFPNGGIPLVMYIST